MKTKCATRGRNGSILLALVLVLLLVGATMVLFITKISGREVLSPGFVQSRQAHYHALGGVEYYLQQALDDPQAIAQDNTAQYVIDEFTVTMDYTASSDVLVSTAALTAGPGAQTSVKINNFSTHVPTSSGTLTGWALEEGSPSYTWTNSGNAHDDIGGPNQQYASVGSEHNKETQGLGGFSIQAQSQPITKVEFILYFHLPNDLSKGTVDMQWQRLSDGKKGKKVSFKKSDFNSAAGPDGTGTLSVELTDGNKVGGWYWDLFAQPDIQIRITTKKFKASDTLNIDCVGFRISWGQQ